ncbi:MULTISPECIES: GntR family transcriptional regulator [unclassified Beijerinckia]|uniref:GntR family transcriptional regulator n=1 Tax=unclassified Beijerinckia TaxID=2638183 RepID=UPI000894C163|nr:MULTISPECIES: GntR family transcriptional regulator [unclassified Beijerinckia]MDH7798829.1 DNA-binding GntR family transcriptional regulator [Beijerinckia sp. GAS462]SED89559.1 DNA-binding transcriptional regulator, GntR family [Beijerinckia sp. 28-YEA-48]
MCFPERRDFVCDSDDPDAQGESCAPGLTFGVAKMHIKGSSGGIAVNSLMAGKKTSAQPVVATAKPAPTGETRIAASRAAVVEIIRAAILDGRLPAGVKLGEGDLASAFSVTRNVVREALSELKLLGFVSQVPNHGAYVSQPTPEEINDVYGARRIIEAGIFTEFAQNCTARDIRTLREHVKLQEDANKRGDHHGLMRLLGEFHLLVAQLNGNAVLAEILERLISRTGLITVLYQESHGQCAVDEHTKLIELLAAGKSEEAAEFLQGHLQDNRSRLTPKRNNVQVNISRIFASKKNAD